MLSLLVLHISSEAYLPALDTVNILYFISVSSLF